MGVWGVEALSPPVRQNYREAIPMKPNTQQLQTRFVAEIAIALALAWLLFMVFATGSNANEYDDLAAQATTYLTFDGSLRDQATGTNATIQNQTATYDDAGSLPFCRGLDFTGTTAGGYVDTNAQLPNGDFTIFARFSADAVQSNDADSSYRPIIWAGGTYSDGSSSDYITATVRRTSGTTNPGNLVLRGMTGAEVDTGVMVADGQPHDIVIRRSGN